MLRFNWLGTMTAMISQAIRSNLIIRHTLWYYAVKIPATSIFYKDPKRIFKYEKWPRYRPIAKVIHINLHTLEMAMIARVSQICLKTGSST